VANPLANPADSGPPPTPAAVAQAREQAAAGLDALAQNLGQGPAQPNQPNANLPADTNVKAQAAALAVQQKELANAIQDVQTKAKADPNQNAAKAQLADQLAPLLARQNALADAAHALPDPIQERDPRRAAERQRAASEVSANRAVDALQRRDPERAAGLAREAATNLERLAEALPAALPPANPLKAVPTDPDFPVKPADAADARALAGRERQIREELQSILGDRIEPQRQLREQAAVLGREAAALRDESRETSPRGQGPANAAADLLQNQARTEMQQGMNQLGQGQVQPARDAQRSAAEHLERAAQQAEDLATAFQLDRPSEAVNEGQADASGDLAHARDAQRMAGQELAQARDPQRAQGAAQSASQAMKDAAQSLRAVAAAQAQRGTPKGQQSADGQTPTETAEANERSPGKPQSATKDPQSAPAGTAEADLSELKELIRTKTGRSWGELPGHLRTEILQMSQGKYRDEYARLIQLYFKEIADGQSSTLKP
jgi:hypothetical protein